MSRLAEIRDLTLKAASEAIQSYFSPVLLERDRILRRADSGRTPSQQWMEREAAPDLHLQVHQERQNGQTKLSFALGGSQAPVLELADSATVFLKTNPEDYFRDMFADIEQVVASGEKNPTLERKLQATGSYLTKAILPRQIAEVLKSFSGRQVSLLIETDEIWIPWEILNINSENRPDVASENFLCEAFAMTRWLADAPRPALTLRFKRAGVVAPAQQGLRGAEDEVDKLVALGRAGGLSIQTISSDYVGLTEALAAGQLDLLHFAGHGIRQHRSTDRSSIRLEGETPLEPQDLFGPARKFGEGRPFVFLNACFTGRGENSLTDTGGWAKQFIDIGVGGFVGALWSIRDESAVRFATSFYEKLWAGKEIGRAAQESRLQLKEEMPYDVTRLAYTVYSHPHASAQTTEAPAAGADSERRDGPRSSERQKQSGVSLARFQTLEIDDNSGDPGSEGIES